MTTDEPQPAGAPESTPVDEAEVARRTGLGIARWLQATVALFWLALGTAIVSHTHGALALGQLALMVLLGSLVVNLILYFSLLLEAGAFNQRPVRIWLAVSFGDMVVMSLISLAVRHLMAAHGPTALTLLPVICILAGLVLLVLAYRRDNRYLFLLALGVLLASNLIPV